LHEGKKLGLRALARSRIGILAHGDRESLFETLTTRSSRSTEEIVSSESPFQVNEEYQVLAGFLEHARGARGAFVELLQKYIAGHHRTQSRSPNDTPKARSEALCAASYSGGPALAGRYEVRAARPKAPSMPIASGTRP